MATSVSSPSLQLQFPLTRKSPNRSTPPVFVRPIIRASVSKRPSISVSRVAPTELPVQKIPGHYGLPLIGPIKDRLDYFYNQGRDEYFKSHIQNYHSTVFRTNMPLGPFIAHNPKVVALLDGKSFPVLFDVTKVEKKDVFTGTFMPSIELTGGYRVLSYLDHSEPGHEQIKRLMFFLLKSSRDKVIPEFNSGYTQLFNMLENELPVNGKVSFGDANDQTAFNFLAQSLYEPIRPMPNLGSTAQR